MRDHAITGIDQVVQIARSRIEPLSPAAPRSRAAHAARRQFGRAPSDLKAVWRAAPRWSVEARLLNLADHDTEPVRDYQALGRQAWLGLRYEGPGL